MYGDVKVGDHCHITGKYRGCTYRDCIINVKLNHKIPVVFNNLQKLWFKSYLQELYKFNLKINVISNGLEKFY